MNPTKSKISSAKNPRGFSRADQYVIACAKLPAWIGLANNRHGTLRNQRVVMICTIDDVT